MGFFDRLKRAFGFDSHGDDLDDILDRDVSALPLANPFHTASVTQQRQVPATAGDRTAASTSTAVSPVDTVTTVTAGETVTGEEPMPENLQQAINNLIAVIKATPVSELTNSDELAAQSKRLAELQARFAAEQQRANDLSTLQTSLQEQLLATQRERDSLKQQCNALEARTAGNVGTAKEIAALRQVIDSLTGEKAALEDDLRNTGEKLDNSIEQIKQLNNRLTDANTRMVKADKAIADATAAREATAAAEQRAQQAADRLNAVQQQADDRAEQLQVAATEIEQQRVEIKRQATLIEELERKLNRDTTMQEQRELQLHNENEDLTRRLKQRNNDVIRLEQELAAARQVAREAEQQAGEAMRATREAQERRTEVEQRLAAALMERDDLASTLEAQDAGTRASDNADERRRNKRQHNKRHRASRETSVDLVATVDKTDDAAAVSVGDNATTVARSPQSDMSAAEPTPEEPNRPLDDMLLVDIDFDVPTAHTAEAGNRAASTTPAVEEVRVETPDFDDIDWLVPSPPTSPREEFDPEQESLPRPRQENNDPRQLSLF